MSARQGPDPDIAIAAERLAAGDPTRWSAVLAAPLSARPVLIALGALNLELARAPWASSEPMVAEMRLQWWIDALEKAGDMQGRGAPIPHEIGPAVQMALLAGAPVADLVTAAEARRWDCWSEPFADDAAFDAYIGATSGGMIWATAKALGASDHGESPARDAGYAFGIANLFLAIPELESRKRYPVTDGRPTALSALADTALTRLAASRAAARSCGTADQKALKIACLQGWQAQGILERARKSPQLIAQDALKPSEFQRRAGLLRAAIFGF
jgi:hypothetical protein